MKKTATWMFTITMILSLLLAGCTQPPAAPTTIKIGLQAPLTGTFAAEGEWAQQSVEIAAQ